MLEVCRRRAEASGFAARCQFHEGYLDSLPASEPFDAATSLLVSHFILDPDARRAFFREIADRLRPGGMLASADLASDTTSAEYESLLEVRMELMRTTGISAEQIETMRATYRRDVAIAPPDRVRDLIASAGFDAPVQFLQTALIHAWYARRRQD
jgi:tRNA (cmo5U34)-methyltransferase